MGYYINDNGDECYNDLCRQEHPKWIGWQVIDSFKKTYNMFKPCLDKCNDLVFLYNKYKDKDYE